MYGDLDILECPNSRMPLLRSADGGLISADGRYKYPVQDNIVSFLAETADSRSNIVREYYQNKGWTQDEQGFFADTTAFVDLRKASWRYTSKCMQRLNRHFKDGGHYILDAGSGPIPHDELLQYGAPFRRRVCVDLSTDALRIARSKLGENGVYLQADLTNIPVKTGSIDAVTCNHVLYHIPAERQAAAFRELWRVLRPGGICVVVYAWQRAPIAQLLRRIAERLAKLRRLLRGPLERLSIQESAAPELYYHAHSFDWFSAQPWPFRYRIDTFRLIDNEFMRLYISDSWAGNTILRVFFVFQLLFPGFCGRFGAYPAIVIFKE